MRNNLDTLEILIPEPQKTICVICRGFGTIKSIEIPKDKDGLARYISSILVTASGFAFIAYESTDEASRVLNERYRFF